MSLPAATFAHAVVLEGGNTPPEQAFSGLPVFIPHPDNIDEFDFLDVRLCRENEYNDSIHDLLEPNGQTSTGRSLSQEEKKSTSDIERNISFASLQTVGSMARQPLFLVYEFSGANAATLISDPAKITLNWFVDSNSSENELVPAIFRDMLCADPFEKKWQLDVHNAEHIISIVPFSKLLAKTASLRLTIAFWKNDIFQFAVSEEKFYPNHASNPLNKPIVFNIA